MKALIILAHGSRRHDSNQEIHSLTNEVRNNTDHNFQFVEYAFLELTEPKLLTVINNLVKKGADEITVLPYFLNSGNHVKKDIPEIIDSAMERYPKCKFNIISCIGMYEDMDKIILQHVGDNTVN